MSTVPEPQINRYTRWLAKTRGLHFDATTTEGYDAMWRWSVGDLDAFWSSVWDYFDLQSPTPRSTVLVEEKLPGAQWFPGAQLNYVQQVFRHADAAHAAGHPAIVFQNERLRERGELQEVSWPELRRQVASLAAHLQRLGVEAGDRVVAFLPNTPQTAIAFLAVASLGAVWSVCSPDMGPVAVLDRFRQIAPKVLIACDGYVYGGNAHDRLPVLEGLLAELPSVQHVVLWRYLDEGASPARLASATRQVHDFHTLTADDAALAPRWVAFDHPLWVVYSSGTTGLPKPIVHGHGGVVLEAIKMLGLHNNLGATVDTGDRYHWYSATGWIMWNSQVAGLLLGTTICIYDGSPSGKSGQPDWSTLWRFADDTKATFFGAGSAFYASCLKADVRPKEIVKLAHLRALGATGSPLATECYRWAYDHVPKVGGRDIWFSVISGGTDFAGAFIAGLPTLPVVEGQMQCRCLGAAVEAWNEKGEPLIDEVGELVCAKPMPSMPLYFWNDEGHRRYHDSYFDMYPGVWRHGDWIRILPNGGSIIYGRSDATINRHGIRMGTSELYRAVEAQPEVLDSLVVDLEYLGRDSYMPLFVVLREGVTLDAALDKRLREAIRTALSARHVPNEIFQVSAIPRTLSGKKMELPVKKLLLGTPPEQVFKLDAMANADCVPWFVAFAKRRAGPP
ncbi:acetoacetate--CoA ligase [Piscinibacter sp. HJYY11]|uniref:acetoacetate--CoA ligase n=1 Tax=Piscinibacter sp. HJYY11 TaxID=2801333 RepID=UPI00191E0A39|nr:acetoacetate--CoA ligase [Piscinibacter sp. HJYY11]MBL0728997.1 acetoacetate--CoA ligase [Piscinibacter sp. HJYY11]